MSSIHDDLKKIAWGPSPMGDLPEEHHRMREPAWDIDPETGLTREEMAEFQRMIEESQMPYGEHPEMGGVSPELPYDRGRANKGYMSKKASDDWQFPVLVKFNIPGKGMKTRVLKDQRAIDKFQDEREREGYTDLAYSEEHVANLGPWTGYDR
jgi:hypothetical protein